VAGDGAVASPLISLLQSWQTVSVRRYRHFETVKHHVIAVSLLGVTTSTGTDS